MRNFRLILASLLTLVALGLPVAQASEAERAPYLTYSDSTGLKFLAIPAIWKDSGKSIFQWFVNGKAIPGATKLSFIVNKSLLGKKIQFKESRSGTISPSVVGVIGQIIINSKPQIEELADSTASLRVIPGAVSPKTSKVVYKWYKGPIDIPGAKLASYRPTTADQGFKIYVNAKYSLKGFKDNSTDSGEVAIPVIPRVYKQLWEEEFVGAAGSLPNSQVWTSQDGDGSNTAAGGGWGNRERQYYVPSLATLTDQGALLILATKSGADKYTCYYKGACEWVSGKYITKDKVTFKYGRFEARIKGPVGAGTWGAFWMLGADIDDRPWPWCGEIDVTELVGKDPLQSYGYLHGLLSGGFGGRGTTVSMPNGFASEYHTYAVDWLPDQVDWYLDGVLFGSQPKVDKDWVFDHPFYLIVNLAMGGNLGGPIDPTLNQASMDFDWIRFYSINGVGEVFKN
jgi:hypothetical protein